MTINEAITEADEICANSVPSSQKVRWLRRIDQRIVSEIYDKYEGIRVRANETDYNEDTPGSTILAVPDPYSHLYPLYIQQQIEYQNGEQERYNNATAVFEQALDEFRAYVNRTFRHKQAVFCYYR